MYYYNNELPTQYGWICPKCGRVNAPWLPTCDCVSSQTTGIGYTFDTSTTARKGTSQTTSAEQTELQTEKPKIRKRIDKPFRAVWLDDDHNEIGTPQTDCPWK